MRVRITPEAYANLGEIHSYIAADNPRAADAVIEAIEHTIDQLGRCPEVAVRKTDRSGVRMKTTPRYRSYRIFYTIENDDVLILYIRHAARQEP